jgi:hypothetical protein
MARRIQEGHGRSHVKGVAWSEPKRKWRAQIQLHLGYYDSEEEAGRAYVEAEELFRQPAWEFRRTHEPELIAAEQISGR